MPTSSPNSAFSGVPRKAGKPIDLRQLKRDISWVRQIAAEQKTVADRMAAGPRVELSACPVCASRHFQQIVSIYDFPYCECTQCGHVFLKTPPHPEAVTKLYTGSEEERCCHATAYLDEELFQRRVRNIAIPKVEFVSGVVQPGGLWVDIGCATGEIMTAAQVAGWSVSGIEADEAQVDFARKKGLSVQKDYVTAQNARSYLGDASVVSCINLVEHLNDPRRWVKEVADSVRIGTHIVIEVPRHPSLSSFANIAFPGLVYRQFCAPDHLHVFSEKSMERVLNDAGLQAVAVWTFGQDFRELIASTAVSSSLPESDFLNQLLDSSARMQQAVDENGLSDTLFLVAKRV